MGVGALALAKPGLFLSPVEKKVRPASIYYDAKAGIVYIWTSDFERIWRGASC